MKKIMIVGIIIVFAVLITCATCLVYVKIQDSKEKKSFETTGASLASQNYEDAVTAYEKALAKDPENEETFLGLVDACLGKKDTKKAEKLLRERIGKTSDKQKLEAYYDRMFSLYDIMEKTPKEYKALIKEAIEKTQNSEKYEAFNEKIITKDPLAIVSLDKGKQGFIKENGEVFLEVNLPRITPFSKNGLAAAMDFNEKWGYIDMTGEWVIQPQYVKAGVFGDNGLAPVQTKRVDYAGADPYDQKCGYINAKGEWVIPPTQLITEYDDWEDAGEFASNGLAKITYYSYDNGYKKGYINAEGKWVIEGDFISMGKFNDDGMAYVEKSEEKRLKKGWIDQNGNWLFRTTASYRNENFSKNQMIAAMDINNGQYGYQNMQGEWVIPSQFASATNFGTNFAAAQETIGGGIMKKGDKWGVIDETGNWVLEPQPSSVFIGLGEPGVNDLIPAHKRDHGWGYINEKGEWVIEPQFNQAEKFISIDD